MDKLIYEHNKQKVRFIYILQTLLFESMVHIDITAKLEDFYRYLSESDVDRTIFSIKFCVGKAVFLSKFKEK